jgi:hypothetical protein
MESDNMFTEIKCSKLDNYPFDLIEPIKDKEYMEAENMDEDEDLYDMSDWRGLPHFINEYSTDVLEAGIARTVLQVKVDLSRMSEDGKEMFDAQGLIYDSQMGNYQFGCNAWRVYVRCSDEYDCNPLERQAVESVAWSLMYRAAARLPEDVLKQLYKRFADEGFEFGYEVTSTKLSDMVAEPLMDYLRAMALNEKEY